MRNESGIAAVIRKLPVRVLWLPILMFGVAALVAYYGVGTLANPSAPRWLGWLVIGVAAIKATVWAFYAWIR